MKQRIAHGAILDAATSAEVAAIGDKLDRQRGAEHRYEPGVINLDGSGNGNTNVKPGRSYNWHCERLALVGLAGATVVLTRNSQPATIGQVNGADLAEVVTIPASGIYSDSFDNTMFVAAGTTLFVACFTGAANGQVTFNIQLRMVKVDDEANHA